MNKQPRLFLCSDVDVPPSDPICQNKHLVTLSHYGKDANVNVRLEDVAKVLQKHLTPRLVDLLEIAAYVYAADCSTSREGWTKSTMTENWQRDFTFVIPVRDHAFWSQSSISTLLIDALQFLSSDKYTFDFRPSPRMAVQEFLDYGEEDWPFYDVERVIMFSGGLDSLAGAVETAKRGERLVLVSHRSVPAMDSRQKNLFNKLKDLYGAEMTRIPVWVNKAEKIRGDYNQRTRSFLFSALGVVIASSVRAGGVRFFENGVVSLNWPLADEALQSRASRTTHPKSLNSLKQLYRAVLANDSFEVDNPFIFKTKAEVIQRLVELGGSELIASTCSCAHTGPFKMKGQAHCGACSQCIDRRISVIAAGAVDADPDEDYAEDVFIGRRKEKYEQGMGVQYVRHGFALAGMTEGQMMKDFNLELSRVCRFVGVPARDAAESLLAMHQRHGANVEKVVTDKLRENLDTYLRGHLEPTSLLAKVAGMEHQKTTWVQLAERIENALALALPKMCPPDNRPANEKRLQELCDGILTKEDEDMRREFPFVTWSFATAKPDFSFLEHNLWIEVKYVRSNTPPSKITDDIAADITKYGDNCVNVLYVVYDPEGRIADKREFASDIETHDGMRVAIIP